VNPEQFFMVIAGTSFLGFLMVLLLDEPRGTMSEVLPDGTVQVIELE
jgi:NNP family nitrate/nitrite transporter-like MFS transporter